MEPSWILDYCVSRYTTEMLHTFELTIAAAVLAFAALLHRRGIDGRSLWVFAVGAGMHSAFELLAEGFGVRTVADAAIFGIPIGFPVTALITGAFEGGVVALMAWHLMAALTEGDGRSGRLFALGCAAFAVMGAAGALQMRMQLAADPQALSLTRRALFHPHSLALLTAVVAPTLAYFALSPRVGPGDGARLAAYYLGIVGFTLTLALPLHLASLRFIEVSAAGGYAPASPLEQALVMYAWNLPLEAGWYLPYFAVMHRLGLTRGRQAQPAAMASATPRFAEEGAA